MPPDSGAETFTIASELDVVAARQLVRECAMWAGFGLVDQTKLVTAASELARNTLDHGGGGVMRLERLDDGCRKGVRVIFEDRGPGIADLAQALTDGFSTGRGLGLGLGGARRLASEFAVDTTVGVGTRVTVTRWGSYSVRGPVDEPAGRGWPERPLSRTPRRPAARKG